MKAKIIISNDFDDQCCIEMDKLEQLEHVRHLLSKQEYAMQVAPTDNYPYRTMDVFDDLPF